MIAVSTSLSSRNEPGNAGLYNGIESDPRLDSFANLPHGVLRKGGDVNVLLDPAGGCRGGQEGRPALDSPGEQDLRGGLVDALGDSGDDRIFQQLGLATVPQRRERLQHDAILSAIFQKVPLREIRMRLDVNNCRLDPRDFEDVSRLFQADVGQSDGLALTLVYQALQRPPCIQQRNALVVDHIAVRIPRVLLVSRLEGKGGVDEMEIDVVELEFLETGLEGGFGAFRTMIVVPELRGDEHVLPLDLPPP